LRDFLQMIGSESARELPPKKSSSNHQTPDTMKFFAEEDTDVFAKMLPLALAFHKKLSAKLKRFASS